MAILSPGSNKKCVTCQHFSGAREADASKRNVRYDATCKGSCLATKLQKAANSSGCPKWVKWAALK